MLQSRWFTSSILSVAIACAMTVSANAQVELTTNGNFDAGDLSGWSYFPTASSSFTTTTDFVSPGFAGQLFNAAPASAAVIKQANIGMGIVNPGQEVTISFDAKGLGLVGGVSFAEFFSEIDGGGTSSSVILGGGPLSLTSDYQTFSFTTLAGPDVSGGVTLQLTATTGGAPGSLAVLLVDNVSVSVIPEPTSASLLALGGLGLFARRRRS